MPFSAQELFSTSCSRPFKVFFPSANFKMTFYDAQIDFQAGSDQAGFCRHTVPIPLEAKLLLVDRRWRKQCGFDPALVPFRRVRSKAANV
jgi:hypothetical protein